MINRDNKNTTCFIRVFMLLATMFIANSVHAGAYVQLIARDGVMMTGQVTAWPQDDDDEPNPCYGWPRCYVGIDLNYDEGGPGLQDSCGGNNAGCVNVAQAYKTRGEVRANFARKLGIPYTTTFGTFTSSAKCLGLFYSPEKVSGYSDKAALYPGSICGVIPDAQQVCSITAPAELDHGTLNSDVDLTTSTAQGNVVITCLYAADVKIFTYSTTGNIDKIYLDSDEMMYATLTIDGTPSANGVLVSVAANNVPKTALLRSQLHGTPVVGDHNANAVVLLAYQ